MITIIRLVLFLVLIYSTYHFLMLSKGAPDLKSRIIETFKYRKRILFNTRFCFQKQFSNVICFFRTKIKYLVGKTWENKERNNFTSLIKIY
jgi:hypothetical protein